MNVNPIFLLGDGLPAYNRTQLLEVPITGVAAGTVCPLKINNIITNDVVLVYALAVYSASQLAVSPSGVNVIADADVPNLTITIQDRHTANKISNSPYFNWNASFNLGYPRMIIPAHIVLDKCSVNVVATGTLATTQVALIEMTYFTLNDLVNWFVPYVAKEMPRATPAQVRAAAQKAADEFYETVA